jgi:chorismate-pyruvate lyase
MKFTPAPAITSIQWLPAERLGPLNVDANVRPCLIAKGLLSARRSRVARRGAPLLMQEVFLPAMGHP